MPKMVKRLISAITCLIFIVDSSGQYSLFSAKDLPGYNLLRPAAFKNSNQKSSSSGTIVIDTEELDLKKSRAITVQEMLSKFAQKHPEIIKDPEAVLIVMREQDAKLIFKLDFNNKKGAPVKKGERYRIAYEHPLLRIDTRLPLPRGIWVSLGGLTPREKETFEDILSTIGKIRWRSKFISTLLTEKWIEKEEAEGVSKVEFTKKLLLYYYKEFEYKPGRYDDKVAGLYFVLNTLLQDKEVDKFLSQLVKAYYAGGEEAYVKDTHFGGEKVFVDDFDFLLSLFIDRENNDIHSIAIHSVMEAEGFSKGPLDTTLNRYESRLPLFA